MTSNLMKRQLRSDLFRHQHNEDSVNYFEPTILKQEKNRTCVVVVVVLIMYLFFSQLN